MPKTPAQASETEPMTPEMAYVQAYREHKKLRNAASLTKLIDAATVWSDTAYADELAALEAKYGKRPA